MSTYKVSLIIRRPVEEVFAFMADLDTWPQWRTGIVELKDVSANPLETGSSFTVVTQFRDRPMDVRYTVTEFEPNKSFTVRSPGNLTIEIQTTFEAIDEGTRIRHRSDLSSSGMFRIAQPVVARMLKGQVKDSYIALKKLLEAPAT